jgi:DNA-directed RNA polymerase specialized sigma24 family protein
VPTYADGHLRPGELLEEATRLVAGAEATLRMAVVAERLRGTSWAEIGEALGVTPPVRA